MADKRSGGDKHEPTLELPKLFGGRRRRSIADEPPAERSATPSSTADPTSPEPSQPAEPDVVSTDSTMQDDGSTKASDAQTPRPEHPLFAGAPRPETQSANPARDKPPEPAAATEEPGARKAARPTPLLPPRLAAVLTGLIVGAVGTLLTYGSLRGCEALTGTGSCGGGPGLLLLVAIFAVMVLLGGALLKAWVVTDPQSTSFLAVGITAVVVMLTLLETVFSLWIFLAVPLVTMAAYLVAHWVTTRFVEGDRDGAGVDVR